MTLGQRLRFARGRKGWSQNLVCQKLGISNSGLSGYERDYREPDAETLKKLADIYEVSVDYLLGRTDNPNHIAENSNLYYFDKGGLTEEDLEYLEQSIEIMKERARKRAEKKKQRGGD